MSILNAPLALSPPTISFDTWLCELDRICEQRLSISLDDLLDLSAHDAYYAGVGPAVFFELAVLPRLSANDVSFPDVIARDAPDHEDLLDGPLHEDH